MGLSLDPGPIALLALGTGLYIRAVRVLARRGWAVPRGQQLMWHSGMLLMAVGLLSPVDGLGDDLLSAHMAQHLLIADLAAPLLLAGLRTPVLVFFLPRGVLVPLARSRGLRRLFRFLRRPLVAIPVWMVILYGWHLSFAFEGALRNDLVHAIQHQFFIAGSLLVWWPALEPNRARMPGELWKGGYVLGARLVGMFLGMAFIIMRSPAYVAYYGNRAHEHGLSPLVDQQVAGGLMLSVDLAIMLGSVAFFFFRAAADHDRAERSTAAVG